jgi:crotonobetainyl-CoA hydratase
MTSPVLVERHGHVLLLTLNRPHVRNAVDQSLSNALGDALNEADRDIEVRAIVVTGAGTASFCAGADLKALARGESVRTSGEHRAKWGFAGFVTHHVTKPTIAAVNGFAMGGGTEIVLACDLAVASESATFGLPEVTRGLVAAAGGVFRLPEQIARKVAMEMILTGRPMSAARAYEVGLVNAVVTPDDLLPAALGLAEQISANAPLAVQASKAIAQGVENGEKPSEAQQWELSEGLNQRILSSEDAREGTTAFAERRTPVWRSR